MWTETDQIIEQVVVNKNACVVRTSSAGSEPGTRFFTLLRKIREHPQWYRHGAVFTYVEVHLD